MMYSLLFCVNCRFSVFNRVSFRRKKKEDATATAKKETEAKTNPAKKGAVEEKVCVLSLVSTPIFHHHCLLTPFFFIDV